MVNNQVHISVMNGTTTITVPNDFVSNTPIVFSNGRNVIEIRTAGIYPPIIEPPKISPVIVTDTIQVDMGTRLV